MWKERLDVLEGGSDFQELCVWAAGYRIVFPGTYKDLVVGSFRRVCGLEKYQN